MALRSNSLDSFDFAMHHQARPTMSYILLVIHVCQGGKVSPTLYSGEICAPHSSLGNGVRNNDNI